MAIPGAGHVTGTATHAANFNTSEPQKETTRNPHGPLTVPCENCHTAAAWRPIRAVPEFDHNKTKYPLRGMHEKVQCVACHVNPVFTNVGKNCADCHADIHRRQMGSDCAQCHTVTGWNIAVQQVKDHQNRFPLLGAHAAVQCEECHKQAATGIFLGLSTQCDSCHLKDWQNTTNPPHQSAGPAFASANCQGCHSFDSWAAAKFDHSTTGFLLTAGHANVPCASCHINNNYNLKIAATDCGNSGCHLTTWRQTNNPVHATSGPAFGAANCSSCHDTIAWTDLTSFNHSITGFTLTGVHLTTACTACHVNNNYTLQIQPNDCGNSGCHLTQWNSTQTLGGSVPNHITAGFPIAQCSTCHNTTSWATATFDHSTTGFPLTNSHQMAPAGKVTACAQCHINNNYALTIQPNDCGNSGCHLTTWQTTNNPVHSTSGAAFAAANCVNCHTTVGWDGASFNHAVTGFALVGTHNTTPCAQCHVNNNYTLNSADCMGCHQPAWTSTQTMGGNVPNHVGANFPTSASACSTCHTITVWANGVFDHSSTGFPLTNSHQMSPAGKVTACTQCHVGGNYALTTQPNDCGNSGCHMTDWTNTNNPTHSTSGPTFAAANCVTCHNTVAWTTATFDHSTTGFALTGTHATTPCAQCHTNNNYTLNSADCMGCHLTAWNSTQTMGGNVPNHVGANFPTSASACSTCHTITVWANGVFNHSSTGFPLTNSHQMSPAGKVTACTQCHVGGNYALTTQPTDCGNSGCHLTTWQTTNNPTHSTAGTAFGAANCSTCHDTITWTDNSFNHSVTGFTLTGAHISPTPAPCVSCHVGNNYTLTIQPTDCGNSACHLTQWNSTQTLGGTIPNHITAGFPMAQCSSCHDTVNWANSTFNHANTGFPLTGLHAAVQCATCHGTNYSTLAIAPTDCGNSGCHLTAWQQTNNPVHPAAGTTFAATNCQNCHSTAAAFTTTSWTHTTTGWALTGNHQMAPAGAATNCNQCHVGNNYNLTVTDCYNSGCHTTDWNNTATMGGVVPNHVAANFPTSLCSTCHDTLLWADGKFDHSTTGWALTGGHVVPTAGGGVQACTDCHVSNNYSLTSANTLCYGCHLTQWTSTQTLGGAVPNHLTANYPTTCETCHTTATWLGATFNHTWFRIPHHSSVCNDCHQVSTDYTQFTCINCHTNTNAHRPGMSHPNVCSPSPSCWYGPTTCYNCHHG